jgi:uncharacterized protein
LVTIDPKQGINIEIMLQHILIGVVVFCASFVTGTTGFGFALISVPLLSAVKGPKFAVPFALLCGNIINGLLLLRFRGHIELKRVVPLLLGALPGIPAGVYIFRSMGDEIIKPFLGGVVVAFAVWDLWSKKKERGQVLAPFWAYLTGFSSGLLSAAAAMSGPPILVYLSRSRWDKNLTRATLQSFFLITDAFAIIALAIEKVVTLETIGSTFLYLPVAVLGGGLGYLVFRVLDVRIFHRMILFALIGIGGLLILL